MISKVPTPVGDKAHLNARETWVQQQLVRACAGSTLPSLHAGAILILVLVAFLAHQVPPPWLALWGFSAMLATYARYAIRFSHHGASIGWVWAANGVVWGSLMLLILMMTPLLGQVVCMLVLVAQAGFAVRTLAPCQRAFKGFVNAMGLTASLALAVQLVVDPEYTTFYAILALTLLIWCLNLHAGLQLHSVLRDKLELQFDNEALISELRENNKKAIDAVAVKNRFIASAAHDLRQPVHAMELYAAWLIDEPQFVAQIGPKIARSAKAISDLFESLFRIAGLESDPMLPSYKDVDLRKLLKDLELQYTPMADSRALRLRTRLGEQLAMVRTDPVLVKRLVGNFLSNAMKNTRKGGVLLALRRQSESWSIEVWDTGVGIAPEHQRAIFQEFYRIPMQGTEEGFGLGLAIVTRLSQALKLPVSLGSKVGRGSVFKLAIPLVHQPGGPCVKS